MAELGIDVIDVFAFIVALIYTFVPIAFFYQYSAGVIKQYKVSILGILCLYLNGLIYFIATITNGIGTEEKVVLRDFSNLSGAILGFGYCIYYCYIMFYKDHRMKFYIYLLLIFIPIPFLILLACLINKKETIVEIYEYVGVIFNIFEYLPLGFNFLYLIKNKISEKYTLFSSIPGILNTLIWLAWAADKAAKEEEEEDKKIHSLIANIIGFLLCLTQIIIFFLFKQEDDITDALLEKADIEEKKIKEKEKQKSEYDEFL